MGETVLRAILGCVWIEGQICSVESCISTTKGVEDSIVLAGEETELNIETMKWFYVADSSTFPKLTDLPVIRCVSKVLITVTMISMISLTKRNMANQIPHFSSQ